METIQAKRIVVDKGVRKTIAAETGANPVTIRTALAGNIKTALHVRIREAAKNHGGVEI